MSLDQESLPTAVRQLPIFAMLSELLATLNNAGTAVLQAPPGAGKTTAVPLALLAASWLGPGTIVMLEPRRLAARAAASRMASLLGESTGQRVGFHIKGERRSSADTRILVVTEGVLTRMLQSDPALESIAVVIFDEFHERSLHADTALAFTLQSRELLRDDLKLLVMSATLDTDAVAGLLGNAPVLQSEGRSYPVETFYAGGIESSADTRGLTDVVAQKVIEVLAEHSGSVLVFLPGAGEIRRCQQALGKLLNEDRYRALSNGLHLAPLYGDLARSDQDNAIAAVKPGQRKVVLSTNIAETSITIDGIRIVIDSGLMRETRFNPGRGMNRLETVFVSQDSADQRRGRAGRVEAGICIRLWQASRSLEKNRRAEILNSDLSQLALELAQWGVTDAGQLLWIDTPPRSAMAQATELLQRLGALDANGRITTHGSRMLSLGVEPRLANMMLMAAQYKNVTAACQLASLVSERDFIRRGQASSSADLAERLVKLQGRHAGVDAALARRINTAARQFQQRLTKATGKAAALENRQTEIPIGVLMAFAYPDRIAASRGASAAAEQVFLLANGRGARLPVDDPLAHSAYLVVADLDGGQRDARIYRAVAIALDDIERWLPSLISRSTYVRWDDNTQRVLAQAEHRLGAITLHSKRIDNPDRDRVKSALVDGLRRRGLAALALSKRCHQWIARVNFLRSQARQHADKNQAGTIIALELPDLSEQWLIDNLEHWLMPYLTTETRLDQFKRLDLSNIIQALVPWEARRHLDVLAPSHITVPSGSSIAIDYCCDPGPVLAVRLQEVFGLQHSPVIANGLQPLLIHLLSPASRPVQITSDLASFWASGYQEVKKELRGKYKKHYWPDDPLTAVATSKTRKNMNR